MEARAQGITVFAVGVGSEITTSELVSIANKPSSTYVLYAEDYTTIDRIRDSMEQKLCEGNDINVCEYVCVCMNSKMSKWPHCCLESVCPTRIPVASRDEKGFELMLGMNVQKKAKKIPGSLMSETAYALTASTDITENTRYTTVLKKINGVPVHFRLSTSVKVFFFFTLSIQERFFQRASLHRMYL